MPGRSIPHLWRPQRGGAGGTGQLNPDQNQPPNQNLDPAARVKFSWSGRSVQEKRDILCDALDDAGFSVLRPAGAMYVQVDVTHLMPRGDAVDSEPVTRLLIEQAGVGSVPSSDFYVDDSGRSQVRCFASAAIASVNFAFIRFFLPVSNLSVR
jgi:aspartate/methionine/tyrosine aminotransferase